MTTLSTLSRDEFLHLASFVEGAQGPFGTLLEIVADVARLRATHPRFRSLLPWEHTAAVAGCESVSEMKAKVTEDRQRMLARSDAKKRFRLTDANLDNLNCVTKANPYYKSAAPMRLYKEVDLIRAALLRHGSKVALDNYSASLETRSRKRKATVRSVENERRTKLQAELAKRALVLRDDSRLCYQYITTGQPALGYVVDTMDEMHFYHNYTTYREQYRLECLSQRELIGRYVQSEVSEVAKYEALRVFAKQLQGRPTPPTVPDTLRSLVEELKNA